jgi:hypothetical protein
VMWITDPLATGTATATTADDDRGPTDGSERRRAIYNRTSEAGLVSFGGAVADMFGECDAHCGDADVVLV